MIDKPALRARMRAERDAFFASGPAPIAPPPELLALLRPGLVVASYIAVGSEADPSLLAEAAAVTGCQLVLPHITRRGDPMRFLEWETNAPLVSHSFGLSQPSADAPELAPDVILTPLLAFDAKFDRLGQGAGFYDRAFEQYPDAVRVGVAWEVQRVDALPVDAWDMPLHAIVTETGWRERT